MLTLPHSLRLGCGALGSLCAALSVAQPTALPAQGRPVEPVAPTTIAPRTPAEQRAKFLLPPGYRLDCVAAEPLVIEPVMAVFDAAGRLWVCEMRTYVQDVDGSGTDDPKSTIAVLHDDDHDGQFDRRTVYADGLVLPRMLLPLDATRTLFMETYDGILWLGHDHDGDAVMDRREEVHRFGRSGANLEHQDSALVWGLDNWLYTAMGGQRLRFAADGSVTAEPVDKEFAQWGLAVDDLGRQFFSSAGGERPGYGFQQHPVYGKVTNDGSLAPGFAECFPALAIPDVQGGKGRLRANGTLNHFTGCCGQMIHRGGAMPDDLLGDYLLPEPVGRLIRRAEVRRDGARVVLHNSYEHAEFVSSTDPNFRPIWMTDGPDGAVYVVDMYRGIIQESNWVREGSYLRPVAQELGLDKNIGRGRIWRLTHEAHATRPVEDLHAASPARLCELLGSPSGHLRDTAQRLLVLRGQRDVAATLRDLATTSDSALGRIHAMWTLEGLGIVDGELLIDRMENDTDPRVRGQAMRIGEVLLRAGDADFNGAVLALADAPDLDVRIQVVQSLRYAAGDDRCQETLLDLLVEHADDPIFQAIGRTTLSYGASPDAEFDPASFDAAALVSLRAGRDHYRSLCIACHGPDGQGVEVPGSDFSLAPPLKGSRRLLQSPDVAVRILLQGMTGRLDGKDYPGNLMAPMGAQDDEWIASVLTYARNAFGNAAAPIRPTSVARIRAATADRKLPWKPEELERFRPVDRETMRSWTWSASHVGEDIARAFDGKASTRYTTGTPMRPGMWLQVDFGGTPWRIDRLVLDCRGSKGDYPRGYRVLVSDDGEDWSEPLASGNGGGPVVEIEVGAARPSRFLRIEQTGSTDGLYWSIHELDVYGAAAGGG